MKSFRVVAEKLEADKAVIAVTIAGHGAAREKAADNAVRYNFVRTGEQWKIDDITGASAAVDPRHARRFPEELSRDRMR